MAECRLSLSQRTPEATIADVSGNRKTRDRGTHLTRVSNPLLLVSVVVEMDSKPEEASLDALLSEERFDRSSPELWPDTGLLQDVTEFASSRRAQLMPSEPKSSLDWLAADGEKDDTVMLHELGSLTTSQLVEKVRGLQNLAYQLGLDEAKEMTRGKFLNILGVDRTKEREKKQK